MQESTHPVSQDSLSRPFRPRARLLQLLGDELIGSARLAVFELVKNAYDADSDDVVVTLDLRAEHQPSITVVDRGDGMTLEVLQNIWLIPGDDHRQKQRRQQARTKKHNRLPLGEKGIGRFAVHKLGSRIEMVTRAENSKEYLVSIDWTELIKEHYLEDAPVRIQERQPVVFTNGTTGTKITITKLRQEDWTRGEVRRLYRQITSICSPFEAPGSFQATLSVLGSENWIADLPDPAAILEKAIWKFTFALESDGCFKWKYEFRQIPGLKVAGRDLSKDNDSLLLPMDAERKNELSAEIRKHVTADANDLCGIGPIKGEFYVYDRDRELLKLLGQTQSLTEYLDENGGIRVYRDGIRVYNYGEPNDDWLGIDLKRVNSPTRGISRNIVLGAIHLSLNDSTDLIEKTNREGFVETPASARIRRIVLGILAKLETERKIDKDRIRPVLEKKSQETGIDRPINELRTAIKQNGMQSKLEKYVDKIEHDYHEMQETLLSAGMSGLNLAVIFHEVERGVGALHQALKKGINLEVATSQAQELMRLLDGFSVILRKDRQASHSARKLITQAKQFSSLRLKYHRIKLVCPFLETSETGFESTFSFNLVLGALTNIIDNAIYWLQVRWSDVLDENLASPRKIYIGISNDFEQGPAVVVADNGPGLGSDPAELLVRPFFTRKPEGMGLGLYYANLAMELNGGQLLFPQANDVDLPDDIDGAVVALIFKGRNRK